MVAAAQVGMYCTVLYCTVLRRSGCTPTGAAPRAGWTRGTGTRSGSAAAGASWQTAPNTGPGHQLEQVCIEDYHIKIIGLVRIYALLLLSVTVS